MNPPNKPALKKETTKMDQNQSLFPSLSAADYLIGNNVWPQVNVVTSGAGTNAPSRLISASLGMHV